MQNNARVCDIFPHSEDHLLSIVCPSVMLKYLGPKPNKLKVQAGTGGQDRDRDGLSLWEEDGDCATGMVEAGVFTYLPLAVVLRLMNNVRRSEFSRTVHSLAGASVIPFHMNRVDW